MSHLCDGAMSWCNVSGDRCVTSTHLDRMWRLVDQHGRRDVTVSRNWLLLVYPLLVDVVGRLVDMAAADQGVPGRSSGSRLVVYSGHDKTLIALLSALHLHDGRWPVLAARVVIELTSGALRLTESGRGPPRYYFRLLYDGRDMTSRLDFCPESSTPGGCPLDNLTYRVFYRVIKEFGFASHAEACAA